MFHSLAVYGAGVEVAMTSVLASLQLLVKCLVASRDPQQHYFVGLGTSWEFMGIQWEFMGIHGIGMEMDGCLWMWNQCRVLVEIYEGSKVVKWV